MIKKHKASSSIYWGLCMCYFFFFGLRRAQPSSEKSGSSPLNLKGLPCISDFQSSFPRRCSSSLKFRLPLDDEATRLRLPPFSWPRDELRVLRDSRP